MTETAATDERRATCACGDVSVRVTGEPVFQAIWACRNCQVRTGSAFGLSAYYPVDQVIERTGQTTTYRRVSDKNRWLDFRFCQTCGATVWREAEFMPDKVGISAGLFEDGRFAPDGAYFCATKPDWVSFDGEIPTGSGPSAER